MKSNWRIEIAESAAKQLKKLAKKNPRMVDKIVAYLREVAMLNEPRDSGKALTANLSGLWRYQVEDFRIICQIDNGKLLITAVNIAHRSDVY